MAKIKINVSQGEITLDFVDTDDLEQQLEKIDLGKIDALIETKTKKSSDLKTSNETWEDNAPQNVEDVGMVNLLKVSEGKSDAVKLAVFLAAAGMSRDEVKKITGITILSS